uniref:Uncharacterized protein n=1 Tax=Arundo donax TaxID=35708 RepID=A0A0A9GF23_ARUDO
MCDQRFSKNVHSVIKRSKLDPFRYLHKVLLYTCIYLHMVIICLTFYQRFSRHVHSAIM